MLLPDRRPIPKWLPASIRPHIRASVPLTITLPRAIRNALRPPADIDAAEWAAKYRIVNIGANVGQWRHEISPQTVEPMRAFSRTATREIVVCAVAQSGKTNMAYNCLGWALDTHPGTAMIVMPSEHDAQKSSVDRVRPMIEDSPRLRQLTTGRMDDLSRSRLILNNGSKLYLAWSNSASALASFPIKYIFFDETDKYPARVGKETDPITLGEKRSRTYRHSYKRIKASTPTTESGYIWKALNACQQIWQWHAKCPHCGTLSRMEPEALHYDAKAEPADIKQNNDAGYICQHCGSSWDERDREQAVRQGRWVATKGGDIAKPKTIGYHLRALEVLDISLGEIASAHLKGRLDVTAKIDWCNDYLAEPYIPEVQERQEDAIARLKDTRPRGLVPEEADELIISADTQQSGFYYEVKAIKYGLSADMWSVREGYVETFADLLQVTQDDYRNAKGDEYRIMAGVIDSGGGTGTVPKHSRTAEVYDFCSANRIFTPIKGRQSMTKPYNIVNLEHYPGSNKVIRGGLKLCTINVGYYKDRLAAKLTTAPDDPGAMHLHADTSEDYLRQMCSEYKDDQGNWKVLRNRANHYWDVNVYALALLDIKGYRHRRKQTNTQPAQKQGGWINGWK